MKIRITRILAVHGEKNIGFGAIKRILVSVSIGADRYASVPTNLQVHRPLAIIGYGVHEFVEIKFSFFMEIPTARS